MKPRIRVKAPTRMYGSGVPDDARPGDLVVGNRGAAARVIELFTSGPEHLRCLTLEYCGNMGELPTRIVWPHGRVYDRR